MLDNQLLSKVESRKKPALYFIREKSKVKYENIKQ